MAWSVAVRQAASRRALADRVQVGESGLGRGLGGVGLGAPASSAARAVASAASAAAMSASAAWRAALSAVSRSGWPPSWASSDSRCRAARWPASAAWRSADSRCSRQLGEALLGGGDGLVEGLERALEVAVPGRGGGQLGRFGRQGARGDLQPPRLGLQRGQVGGDGEPGVGQPGRQVVDRTSAAPSFAPIISASIRGLRGLGVRGLLLLAGHPLAAELAQLRMVERAADRAGGAVDQGGRELGAHAVDARPAQPRRFLEELGRTPVSRRCRPLS